MNAMNARDKPLRGESLVTWYHEQLRNTLNRSRFNGKIHVIYVTQYGYVRAVVERDGWAERWWFDGGRWKRNTCNTFPAVVMSRSRAAKRPAWNGE